MDLPIQRVTGGQTCARRVLWRWLAGAALAGLAFCGAGLDSAAAATPYLNLNLFQQEDMRAMAMGNAFGPVARGETALQYNPAGLATYDFDLKAEYSGTLMFPSTAEAFITDTEKVSSGSPSPQAILNYLTKYSGTSLTLDYQTYGSAVANLAEFYTGLGAGYLDVHRDSLAFGTFAAGPPPTGSVTLSTQESREALGGLAAKLFDGKVLLGVTAKSVQYTAQYTSETYASIVSGGKLNLNLAPTKYESMTAYDAGLIYRMEWLSFLKPQWSLTAYNIGGYTLRGTNPQMVVQRAYVPGTYNFGFSLQPDIGFVHILVAAEAEDLGQSILVTDPATGLNHRRAEDQLYHAGMEVGFFRTPTGNNWISLRGGYDQGYPTYGAELNLGGFLRAVYTVATENVGWQGHPILFKFTAYQAALGIAW